MEIKVCSKCGVGHPLTTEYFRKFVHSKDGLTACCKACFSEIEKANYRENKTEINKRRKQYRDNNLDNNSAKMIAYRKRYREENRERIKEMQTKFYYDHREQVKEEHRKYRKLNREKLAEYYIKNIDKEKARHKIYKKEHHGQMLINDHNHRAKIMSLPHTLTIKQWRSIKKEFNDRCCYCGEELPLEREHFVPLSKNGEFTINNIVPACKRCNCSKRDKLFVDWYPTYKRYSKKRESFLLKFLNYKNNIQQLALM